MKGYLQRLVQTVTNPAESVHPWTGSMFAAGHQDDFNVVQTEELAPVTAARQSPEVMSPASAQSPQALASTETSPPGAGRQRLISELRTTQNTQDSTPAEPSANREPLVSERIIPEPLVPDATELEITPVQEPETALPPRGRRSLAGAQAVIKPGNTRQLAPGPSLAPREKSERREKKDALPVGDSVAADRGTDEIQIHIGRIEVTAIHQPAPTVPKARNKEISLDAYLKRRDGRAG